MTTIKSNQWLNSNGSLSTDRIQVNVSFRNVYRNMGNFRGRPCVVLETIWSFQGNMIFNCLGAILGFRS